VALISWLLVFLEGYVMKRKVTYIPTLQEYVKSKKKERVESLELNCKECDYYRNNSEVCVWGDNVRVLTTLKTCPITNRDL